VETEIVPLSDVTVRALLSQELREQANVKMYLERMSIIRNSGYAWSLRREAEYIDKQLTRALARLNKINAIFVEHGNRIEI